MRVEDYWTPRQGILLLKSYAYRYIMLVPSGGIIYYPILA
jgi:hypothetical protein